MEEKKTFDERINEAKAWIERKKEAANVWFGENKEIILFATPFIGATVIDLAKILVKAKSNEAEEKGNYIWDPSSGHGYFLKKKSKHTRNKEFADVDRRRAEGENLYDILKDKKMLR